MRYGGLVISCRNTEQCNKFRNLEKQKLIAGYIVNKTSALNPRIRMVGLSERMYNEEFIFYIKSQNSDLLLVDSSLNVIAVTEVQGNKRLYQALVQTDVTTYKRIMTVGKLFVRYDYCSVFDCI